MTGAADVRERVGFIGLGQMGAPMAARLLAAGHIVTVFDPSPEAAAPLAAGGARVAPSPRAVADDAEVVFACLPSPEASRSVALDPEHGVIAGTAVRVLVETSTIGSQVVKEIAAGLSARGIAMLDAPISGGPRYAVDGRLSAMVAGHAATFARVEPLMAAFSAKRFRVGDEPGLAQVAKLVNNVIGSVAMVATYEAVAVGVKAGLDPKVLIEVINASSGRNATTEDKFPKSILPRTFDYGARIGIIEKDGRLFRDEAAALAVPLWACGSAMDEWNWFASQGARDWDFTAAIKFIEGWAGVTIGEDRPTPSPDL
jgi:3-hydroxyisobutyrate dehydrogenase-like beta-hydroxyacid dehydrogenase